METALEYSSHRNPRTGERVQEIKEYYPHLSLSFSSFILYLEGWALHITSFTTLPDGNELWSLHWTGVGGRQRGRGGGGELGERPSLMRTRSTSKACREAITVGAGGARKLCKWQTCY